MKLLTKAIEQKLSNNNDTVADPIVVAKYFNPTGSGTWYAISYNPTTRIFFGYVSLFGDHNDELGYFSLDELENFKGHFGLGIERDIHFSPCPLSQVKTVVA